MDDFTLSYKKKHASIKEILLTCEKDPAKIVGETVSLRGFANTFRFGKHDRLAFIHLVDGSTVRHIQCICDKDEVPDVDWDPLWKHLNRGATMQLSGTIVESPASGQSIELKVTGYKAWGPITDPDRYPLATRGVIDRDTLRSLPHLKSQHLPTMASLIVKDAVFKAWHEAMVKMCIGEIQPTILTGNECESGAFPFTVTTLLSDKETGDMVGETAKIPTTESGQIDFSKDFFGKPVYLTVSAQLHAEAIVCKQMQDKYWMTKAFRAEPSKGTMHLAELLMPEWELIDCDLDGNMDVAEKAIRHCIQTVLKECPWELQLLEEHEAAETKREQEKQLGVLKASLKKQTMSKKEFGIAKAKLEGWLRAKEARGPLRSRLERYGKGEWVRSSHKECVSLMLRDIEAGHVTFEEMPGYDKDLSREHEHYITDVLFGGKPVFVRYFPKEIKGFYMPIIQEEYEEGEPKIEHVDCYDMLMPGLGEVVGASQRIHDHDELVKRMDELGMKKEPLQWYIDLRKDGTVPHGGGGMGMGRLMMLLTGFLSIRDLEEFPRAYGLECQA